MNSEQVRRTSELSSSAGLEPRYWPLLIGFVVCAITLTLPHKLLADTDTQLHIAVGRWILDHGAIPFRDPFSYTAMGKIWVPHEWGSELILAIVYYGLGWGGVIAITELAIFAAFALLTQKLLPYLGPRRAALCATLAFLLTEEHLIARPHIFALPLLVLWMSGLISARDRNRVPSLKLLPVMVLWCNLHGGFIIGLAFCLFLAAEAVIEARPGDRITVARQWGSFSFLALATSLLSPNGIHAVLLPFQMLRMPFFQEIVTEWQSASFATYQPIEVWIIAFLLVALSLGLKLKLTRIAMLLVLLHWALTHVRNAELLGFIAPLLVAVPLSAQLRSSNSKVESGTEQGVDLIGRARLVGAGAAVCAFFGVAAIYDWMGFHPDESAAPVSALEAARRAGLTGPVLNHYDLGGFLIFHNVPVFIDGRVDLYGDAFIARYIDAVNGTNKAGLQHLLTRYAIQWTIFQPSSPVVRQLDRLPNWHRVYADRFAVVHGRLGAGSGAPRVRSQTAPGNTSANGW
jgi:hypothetical protein